MTTFSKRSASSFTPLHASFIAFGFVGTMFLCWVLLLTLALYVVYGSSHLAVGHDLHAVALASGHIHGSKLDCDFADTTGHCEILLNKQPLVIETFRYTPGPSNTISSCTATFAGRPVACTKKWVTSSYWPHGIAIPDATVQEAADASSIRLMTWRTLLLGHSESFMLRAVPSLGLTISLLATIVLPIVLAKKRYLPSQMSKKGRFIIQTLLFVLLSAVSTAVLLATLIPFDYVD